MPGWSVEGATELASNNERQLATNNVEDDKLITDAKQANRMTAFQRALAILAAIVVVCGLGISLGVRSVRCHMFGAHCSSSPQFASGRYDWSGYGVSSGDCARGDVNFEIEARIATYELPGSGAAHTQFGAPWAASETASMYTRTWVGKSGPFCHGGLTDLRHPTPYDGTAGPLGPCLTVNPGQVITIHVANKMDGGMTTFGQRPVSNEDYYSAAANISGVDDIRVPSTASPDTPLSSGWFGTLPASPSDLTVTNVQDIPGRDVSFDDVNLHFHGLQAANRIASRPIASPLSHLLPSPLTHHRTATTVTNSHRHRQHDRYRHSAASPTTLHRPSLSSDDAPSLPGGTTPLLPSGHLRPRRPLDHHQAGR
jgi:hypothetical protein